MNNILDSKFCIGSLEENWMFSIIYRNASTTILNSFLNKDPKDAHLQMQLIKEDSKFCYISNMNLNQKTMFFSNNLYSFIYIRDPIERFISCFLMKIIYHPEKDYTFSPSYKFLNKYNIENKNVIDIFKIFSDYIFSYPEEYHEDHWKSHYQIGCFNDMQYSEVIDFKNFLTHWNSLSNKYKYINKIDYITNKTNSKSFIEEIMKNKKTRGYIYKIQEYYKKDYELTKYINTNINWINFTKTI